MRDQQDGPARKERTDPPEELMLRARIERGGQLKVEERRTEDASPVMSSLSRTVRVGSYPRSHGPRTVAPRTGAQSRRSDAGSRWCRSLAASLQRVEAAAFNRRRAVVMVKRSGVIDRNSSGRTGNDTVASARARGE